MSAHDRPYQQVWMYWEDPPGGVRAPYLDLCHRTLQRHLSGVPLRVLNRDNVFEWLPDLDRGVWNALPTPVYRSDYLRTRLIHRFGGLWMDFDCLVFMPVSELFAPLETVDLVGWGNEVGGRFYNGLFAARPEADFLRHWINEQDLTLGRTASYRDLSWSALGQDIVWSLARDMPYHAWPLDRIAPVMWYEWRRFTSRFESPSRVLRHEPMTIMLWNNVMGDAFAPLSEVQILQGRALLSRLVRIALGISAPSDETDTWTRAYPFSRVRFSAVGRRLEESIRRTSASMIANARNRHL